MHYTKQSSKAKPYLKNNRHTKRRFQIILNRYCRLLHAPTDKERLNVARLNALRLAAAWRAIIHRPSIAPDLVVMAHIPMHHSPFIYTELDAFRMQVDALHARGEK